MTNTVTIDQLDRSVNLAGDGLRIEY